MEKLNLGSFKNSSEWLEVQRNIQEKRRKLKQLHDEIMRMEKQRNHSSTILQNKYRQYNETARTLSLDVPKKNQELYLKWANRILLIWKKRQVKLLREKFYELIPKESFILKERVNNSKGFVLIRPDDAKKQANDLVDAIVDTVYHKLKEGIEVYNRLPVGGNMGNIHSWFRKGEVQCGDKGWAEAIQNGCSDIIHKAMKEDKNSFIMTWKYTLGWFSDWGQHNWIEFRRAGMNKRIIIDPWPSGGRHIYSKKTYNNNDSGLRHDYIPDSKSLPYD